MDLRTIGLPYLKELHSKTQEAVGINIRDGDLRILLERVESSHGIREVAKIGEHAPLHAGAASKVLLAYLPKEKRNEVITRIGLPKLGPRTITNRKKFEKELDKIVRQGFAVSFEERIRFAAAVAAPLKNHTGEVFATLSITGPIMRFTREKIREYSALLINAAARLSLEMGYRNPMQK